VRLNWLIESAERRTFTYSKPLVMHKDAPPEELSRLDIKNWTPTPPSLQDKIIQSVRELAPRVDAMILLDQVDVAETGVVTGRLLETIHEISAGHPNLLILADSRRSLRGWPPVALKMNATELGLFFGSKEKLNREEVCAKAGELAAATGKPVFVTMSENGIIGAARGEVEWVPALPIRGPIDIVGAGDAVTANLTAALSAGAALREALQIAQVAASIVVHQLGTTGTASMRQIAKLMEERSDEK
jgi:bifunctional ADP-heptose synthase (sugar kinase/adenylyltransferase)